MKKVVMAGTLVGALAVGVTAFAQAAPAAKQTPAKPAATAEQPAAGQTADKPAAKKKSTTHAASSDNSHAGPKSQPNTAAEPTAPGAMALGSVHIPKGLKADGKDLPGGTYEVRLTADEAKPDAKGSSPKLERWVEFTQGGKVVGREIVTIIPANEAKRQRVRHIETTHAVGTRALG